MLRFVQFEYPGRLGLIDGRYPVREGGAPDRVLVIQTLGAPHPAQRPGRRRRGKLKPVEPPAEPETVPVTRAMVCTGEPFESEQAASEWLEQISHEPKRVNAEVKEALAVLNRALTALREAAEDPLVHEVGIPGTLSIRIGYGSGEQVADGVWTEARQLPPAPAAKHEELDPHHRVATELAGREAEGQE